MVSRSIDAGLPEAHGEAYPLGVERALFPFAFFLSGVAALLFETLWFRLAGLTVGNTAWAAAIVLSSFMAGLGLGNLTALGLARGVQASRLYALRETGIMLSGIALVLLLPAI